MPLEIRTFSGGELFPKVVGNILSHPGVTFPLGQELSDKPLACLVPTAPTAHGGSKEDLLAMNDTARRAGLYMRSIKDCVCYAKSKEVSGFENYR
jgi:hypothetical protein